MFAFAGKVFEIVAWQNKTPQKKFNDYYFLFQVLCRTTGKDPKSFGLASNKHPFSS
tara:strand:- start:1257 stop:1424 length:168 start_codon:yes stop_codon:yes gene_type:complete